MYSSSKPWGAYFSILHNIIQDSTVRFIAQTDHVVQHNLSAIFHNVILFLNVPPALKLLYPLLLNKQGRHAI